MSDSSEILALLKKIDGSVNELKGRVENLEKSKSLEIDPAKLKASTKDGDLPKLYVVEPDPKKAEGSPGGQLTEPWPDPRTARPPLIR